MTKVRDSPAAARPLDLRLQEADAVVELGGDVELLIRRRVFLPREWRVVRPYHCDVAVFPADPVVLPGPVQAAMRKTTGSIRDFWRNERRLTMFSDDICRCGILISLRQSIVEESPHPVG